MTKENRQAQLKFFKENNIDFRTIPMIVSHFISIGEQAAKSLTDKKIEQIYQQAVEEDKQRKGASLIAPEFQKYILTCCQKLAQLDRNLRLDIIKEAL